MQLIICVEGTKIQSKSSSFMLLTTRYSNRFRSKRQKQDTLALKYTCFFGFLNFQCNILKQQATNLYLETTKLDPFLRKTCRQGNAKTVFITKASNLNSFCSGSFT